jgi:hypothetical protein
MSHGKRIVSHLERRIARLEQHIAEQDAEIFRQSRLLAFPAEAHRESWRAASRERTARKPRTARR